MNVKTCDYILFIVQEINNENKCLARFQRADWGFD